MLRGLLMSLGLYTALPGFDHWDEKSQGWLAPMLPVVGLLLGALWWGIAAFAQWYMPRMLGAVVGALAMPALTGFLHLDGYMDVSDALLSARPREEKRRILKDPLVGGFAVVSLCALLLLQFGAVHGMLAVERPLITLLLISVIARALAGLAVMTIQPLPGSGYARMYHESASRGKRIWCALWLLAAIAAGMVVGWQVGVSCLVAVGAFALSCWIAVRALGGMNGDISGWAICWAELGGLIALACL